MDDFPNIDLSVLTARQREVIEMHYSCCLSYGVIGEFLGISRQAVEQCVKRAQNRLLDLGAVDTSHIKVDA